MCGTVGDTTDIRMAGTVPDVMNASPASIFVGKYAPSGQKTWAHCLHNLGLNPLQGTYGSYIRSDAQMNVYVAGLIRDSVDFDPGPGRMKMMTLGDEDIFLVKYSPLGNTLFARSIGGLYDDMLAGFDLSSDKNLYFNIHTVSPTFDIDFTSATVNFTKTVNYDHVILNTDSGGAVLKHFGIGDPSYYDYHFSDLDENNGSIYMTGGFNGTHVDFDPSPTATFVPTFFGDMDVIVARYQFYAPETNTVTFMSDPQLVNSGWTIYPVPAQTELFIRITSYPAMPKQIKLADMHGRILAQHSISDGEYTCDVSRFGPGIYCVILESGNGVKEVKKVVVE